MNLMQIIPQVQYRSISDGTLSREQINDILTVGTVIVRGGVPQEVRVNIRIWLASEILNECIRVGGTVVEG